MRAAYWSYTNNFIIPDTNNHSDQNTGVPVLVKDDVSYETSPDKAIYNNQNQILHYLTKAQVPIQPCLISVYL